MNKRIWKCENIGCGHVSSKAKTKWVRVSNTGQAGYKVCTKCEGKVRDVS